MALFQVISIIDGDTVKVSPNWIWEGKQGDTVKVCGYIQPLEKDQVYATQKLSSILRNQTVELLEPRFLTNDGDALYCKVLLNKVDVATYFPEFSPVRYRQT